MPIVVECPVCYKKFRFQDNQAGSLLPCKNCGAEMRVPGGSPHLSRRSPGGGGVGGGGNPNWVPLAIGGGVVLVLVVVLISIFAGGSGSNPAAPPQIADKSNIGRSSPPILSQPPSLHENPRTNPAFQNDFEARRREVEALARAKQVSADPTQSRPVPTFPTTQTPERPEASVATHWSVVPDTPDSAVLLDPNTPLKVNYKLPRQNSNGVLMPATASSLVLIGGNNSFNEESYLYDLSTGTRVARYTSMNLNGAGQALSPDGKAMAVMSRARFSGNSVRVIDLKTGQPIWDLGTNEARGVAFLSPTELLEGRGKSAVVWDMKTGQIARTLTDVPLEFNPEVENLSPTGRYLAKIAGSFDQELTIYDLSSGEAAGTITLPKASSQRLPSPAGVAFSQDGSELTALFGDAFNGHLIVWDVATGRELENASLGSEYTKIHRHDPFYKGPKLLSFPGKQRWLVNGCALLERATKEISLLPSDQSSPPRLPVTATQILALKGSSGNAALVSIDLSSQLTTQPGEITATPGTTGNNTPSTTTTAGNTQKAQDDKLPRLTSADRAGVKNLKLEAVSTTQVAADPAPEPMKSLLTRKKTVRLPRDEGNFAQLLLSDGASGRMLVSHKTQDTRFFRRGEPLAFQTWVDLYNLRTGSQIQSLELPYPCDVVGFSPSGTYVAVRFANGQDRIDVWDAEKRTFRAGFRPYFNVHAQSGNQSPRQIVNDYHEWVRADFQVAATQFLDDDHLITINAEQILTAWKLPECRAIYEFQYEGTPGISPGKKYLVAKQGNDLHVIDAFKGDVLASLAVDGQMDSAAFHNGGERLAITVRRGADNFLVLWNLPTGEKLTEFPIPQHGNNLRFCRENLVLLNDSLLLDLDRHAVAWTYDVPPNTYFPNAPDERVWYFGPENLQRRELYITAVDMPEKPVADRVAKAPLAPEYIPLEGKKVKLTTDLASDVPEKDEFDKSLQERYTTEIADVGAVKSALGEIELKLGVSTKQLESLNLTLVRYRTSTPFAGMPLSHALFTGQAEILGTTSVSFEQKQAYCTWELRLNDYPVWSDVRTVRTGYGSIDGSGQDTLEATAARSTASHISRFWSNVKASFDNPVLPTFVFAPGSERGLGTSYLTPEGISDRPK